MVSNKKKFKLMVTYRCDRCKVGHTSYYYGSRHKLVERAKKIVESYVPQLHICHSSVSSGELDCGVEYIDSLLIHRNI